MHEVFITKGDVQGCPDDIKSLINSPFNCVDLHPECHNKAQYTPIGKLLCAKQIILYEGVTRVMTWLFEMNELLKTNMVEGEIRYLNQILSGEVNQIS